MNIWNYIGEFFLFRWLFCKIGKLNRTQEDNSTNIITDSPCIDEAATTIFLTEAQNSPVEFDATESEDELDDLDIFMRNNRHTNYRNSNYDFGRYSDIDSESRYDWNDDHDQSFNDFFDEQDDYDRMVDF